MFRVWGLGFKVWCLGVFLVTRRSEGNIRECVVDGAVGLGFRPWVRLLRFGVEGLGFRDPKPQTLNPKP